MLEVEENNEWFFTHRFCHDIPQLLVDKWELERRISDLQMSATMKQLYSELLKKQKVGLGLSWTRLRLGLI